MFCEIGAWETPDAMRDALKMREWWLIVGHWSLERRAQAEAIRKSAKQRSMKR